MNLQARVKAVLTSPKTEWEVIATEATDVAAIYKNYIVILAAIPAVCSVVGLVIFGFPIVGRPGFMGAVRVGVVNLVPAFAPLGLIAVLYAVYLFYLGLPPVMKTPVDQVVPFMAVAALTVIVVNIVLSYLTSMMGIQSYGF